MKLRGKSSLVAENPGIIKIIPQTLDDLFFLYDKLFVPGVKIVAATSRKVDTALLKSNQENPKKKPIRVRLVLEIMAVEISPVDVSTSTIRIKGFTTMQTEFVGIGTFHTLELELNKKIYLTKDAWDENSIKILYQLPVPTKVLGKTEAAKEFEEFSKVLALKSDHVCYGLKHVKRACEANAVKRLMVTDDLFRNGDVVTRRKYNDLIDLARKAKSEISIFPSKHEDLCRMSGIAAVLRFPFSYCK